MYLLMCVDSNDPGILGKINRFVFRMCPNVIKFLFIILFLYFNLFSRKFLRNYFGNKSIELLDRFFDYICYHNHPLAVVIFSNKF